MRNRELLTAAVLALSLACASSPGTHAMGESKALVRQGTITTTTTVYEDGRKQIVEVCEGCTEEQSEGHPGSTKFYEMLGAVFSAVIGVGSIVLQAVK